MPCISEAGCREKPASAQIPSSHPRYQNSEKKKKIRVIGDFNAFLKTNSENPLIIFDFFRTCAWTAGYGFLWWSDVFQSSFDLFFMTTPAVEEYTKKKWSFQSIIFVICPAEAFPRRVHDFFLLSLEEILFGKIKPCIFKHFSSCRLDKNIIMINCSVYGRFQP